MTRDETSRIVTAILFGSAMVAVGGVGMTLIYQAFDQADGWLPPWIINALPRDALNLAIVPGVLGIAVYGGWMWFAGRLRRFQFCLGSALALHALNLQVICTWDGPRGGAPWDGAVALGRIMLHTSVALLAVILSLVALLQEPPLEHRRLMREAPED